MNALVPRNRYLTTTSGRSLVSRTVPGLTMFGAMVGVPVFGMLVALVGAVTDIGVLGLLGSLLTIFGFVGGAAMAWIFIASGISRLNRASQALMVGDTLTAISLAHWPLARTFRSDVRMRAFYILGLCAEQNGDFAEAEECFRQAFRSMPLFGNARMKRHGSVLMLCHSAIALVATGRLAEADSAVRTASAMFGASPGAPGLMDALTNDTAFGGMGVSAALRDLEPGREPRALLSLVSALVLVSKGLPREGLEIIERERYFLNAGLLPREKALVASIENRARGAYAGGPMRAQGQAMAPVDPWASRVLP